MLHIDPAHAAADAVPTEPSAGDQRREARVRLDGHMAMLTRLAEIGMELAEDCGRQAKAPVEERTLVDPGLTFSRVARAVRLTIALQQRLGEDVEKRATEEATARRARIGHLIERVIEAESDGPKDYRLSHRVWERLTEEEKLDQVAGRPVAEVVAQICEDLGLSPDWNDLADLFRPEDLPPLGEVPDAVGGGGLQGADARDSALQPPSSASRPLPPEGEDSERTLDTG